MLRGFVPRLYQETILATAAGKNTLVVLPTGMGKTGVALLLAAQRLKQFPNSKILMLAPTKPLAEQHLATFQQYFDFPEKMVLFTGEVSPDKRAELWNSAQIIFSTPQGLENDVIGTKIDLATVSLLVFDEAHRATGNYSYVFIAKQYQRKASFPRILALTASPGSELEKIDEVCSNLFIEAVEVRTDKDPDVLPYIQPIDVEWVKVELPEEFLKVKSMLEKCIRSKVDELKKYNIKTGTFISKKELLQLQGQLHAKLAAGEVDFEAMKCVSVLAEIIKAQHALELLETQGVAPLIKYFDKMFAEAETSKVKAVKNLTADLYFKSAYVLAQKLVDLKLEHPKIDAVKKRVEKIFQENRLAKIILFTQYRDTAVKLCEELNASQGTLAKVFVGQQKKGETGLSQKKQSEMLDMFRDGLFNVLIATSVAEEGLDIPKVDVVLFYEPIPSAIRSIQRRGRTGRQEKGKVIVFMTKNTRDEGYLWSSKSKESRMTFLLEKLRTELSTKLSTKQQVTLHNFSEEVKIFADYREKTTGTVKELVELGVSVKLDMLPSADYIVSSRVGVELKTVEDFVDSIIDGRLLEQLKSLKRSFERPVIVLQGTKDIFAVRNIHPNAIRGMLSTIAISYGIPILSCKNEKDSAALLLSMAKREQLTDKKDFSPHADRKPMSIKEQQEYIVSAIPSVGPTLAKELLKNFKSVKNIVNASEEELKQVAGVGDKIAKTIKEIFERNYE